MAAALMRLAELVEPAGEAAQEWLESKDGEDHAAIAEARDRLLAALDESPDLTTTKSRLLSLLEPVAAGGLSRGPQPSLSTPSRP